MKKLVLGLVLALLLTAMVVPMVSASPNASGGYWYWVQKGDTLSDIAYYHGVKLSHLIYVNHIKYPDYIYYGQKLWIPAYDDYGKGDYGKGHYGKYHKVKYGETLSGIAYYYGVSVWAIAKANHIYHLDYIHAGQKLYIPSGY